MLLATALKGNLDLSQPYKPANLNHVCPQYAMQTFKDPREYTVHQIEASKETKFTLLSLQV